MRKLNAFCLHIDKITTWSGKIVSWAVLLITIFIVIDVFLRYIFRSPTVWVWDFSVQLQALIVAIGGSYALLNNGHVNVDLIVNGLPKKRRAVLEIVTTLFILFSVAVLLWAVTTGAWDSLMNKEAYDSILRPPLYPLKIVIALGVALLLLEGFAKLIRNVGILLNQQEENRQ